MAFGLCLLLGKGGSLCPFVMVAFELKRTDRCFEFRNLGVFSESIPGRSKPASTKTCSITTSHMNESIRRLAYSLDMFQQGKEKSEDVFSLPMQQWGNIMTN